MVVWQTLFLASLTRACANPQMPRSNERVRHGTRARIFTHTHTCTHCATYSATQLRRHTHTHKHTHASTRLYFQEHRRGKMGRSQTPSDLASFSPRPVQLQDASFSDTHTTCLEQETNANHCWWNSGCGGFTVTGSHHESSALAAPVVFQCERACACPQVLRATPAHSVLAAQALVFGLVSATTKLVHGNSSGWTQVRKRD